MSTEVVLTATRSSVVKLVVAAGLLISTVGFATLAALQGVYVAIPLLFLIALLPVWDAIAWIPGKTRLVVDENGLTVTRVGKTVTVQFADLAVMQLVEERTGLVRAKPRLSRLMMVPKDSRTVWVSIRPFYGCSPNRWGSTLVTQARHAGVVVDDVTEAVLTAMGTRTVRKMSRKR